jgi:hypothetical protein
VRRSIAVIRSRLSFLRALPVQNISHAKLLCGRVSESRGEIGYQLYKEFGAGKLDGVDFQSVPTDEAEDVGEGFWRLDAALATLE